MNRSWNIIGNMACRQGSRRRRCHDLRGILDAGLRKQSKKIRYALEQFGQQLRYE